MWPTLQTHVDKYISIIMLFLLGFRLVGGRRWETFNDFIRFRIDVVALHTAHCTVSAIYAVVMQYLTSVSFQRTYFYFDVFITECKNRIAAQRIRQGCMFFGLSNKIVGTNPSIHRKRARERTKEMLWSKIQSELKTDGKEPAKIN